MTEHSQNPEKDYCTSYLHMFLQTSNI